MLTIKRKIKFIKILESFFHEIPTPVGRDFDILINWQTDLPIKQAIEFKTIHIDLSKPEDILLSDMSKGTKYEIKRSTADNLDSIVITNISTSDVDEFVTFYNAFAHAKGLKECNRRKLNALKNDGGLILSKIERDEPLCWHAYIADKVRARLLYSASHFRDIENKSIRAMIGRANRSLHWNDILFFKNHGYSIYDLGGISDGKAKGTDGIDLFKKGFGGEVVIEYHHLVPLTLLGKVVSFYLKNKIG